MTPILETEALTRQFGEFTAVNALSLAVDEGEIFGLLGPNGAGKSTTIKMLTTLLPPTSGDALVDGFSIVRQAAEIRRHIGYVPQMLSADGMLSGYENLLIFAKLYDLPRREREERVRTALAFMGLTESADALVRTYSGGMIRRLEIAQSMLHRPRVLFLDEPTVGLDPAARRAVWEHVQRLCGDYGMTIFLTTHLMEEADSLCNGVAIMHLGDVVASGAPAALKASIGGGEVTLDDVFIHYTGSDLHDSHSGGSFRDTSRARRTARRLG
ncbi:ATP-binding cassette domain-containing protein [Aggregatilinea lenta]|uniref:ATP-binding cassette domain-containing protein n=1 Tax=Aggregatilinea lenta TaxID=913108 RepID=UPI000E5C345F|nr:ATP-binding cassette domain-containing protein [Aggregatilinea lenta]